MKHYHHVGCVLKIIVWVGESISFNYREKGLKNKVNITAIELYFGEQGHGSGSPVAGQGAGTESCQACHESFLGSIFSRARMVASNNLIIFIARPGPRAPA